MQKIISACLRYPELLSGSDDWTALAMKQASDKVLLKSGAEGVLCGLLPDQQISFTLKCIDGSARAIQAVTFEVLKNYGILSEAQIQTLWKNQAGTIKNTRDEVVGEIRVLTKND